MPQLMARIGGWLTSGASPRVRDRLLTTLIQRRPAVYISCAALLLMSVAAALITHSSWAYAWLAADLLLIGFRLYLSFRYDDGVRPPVERREAVVASSFLMFVIFGIGCGASISTGEPTLTLMAVVSVMGVFAGLVSRWAAFPRLALLTISLVGAPVCFALATLAGGGVWLAAAQFALVAATTGAQTIQNHHILVRMLRAEQRNWLMARTDLLTGLGNRAQLYERLAAACQRLRAAPDDRGAQFALLYVDLDGFKAINDTHGHAIGDKLLDRIGRALARALADDRAAFRIGGDEFLVLLPGAAAADAETEAREIMRLAGDYYDVGLPVRVRVTASIGIALAPEDGTDPQLLIAHADRALYNAKHAGKDRYVRFAA
jgi:diguanylate cyclase (GGDEF)-like protein